MQTHKNQKLSAKVWIEHDGKPLMGKAGAEILRGIRDARSLSRAAKEKGVLFRYAWSWIKRIEEAAGESVVETRRGGKGGGGSTKLTVFGEKLLNRYERLEKYLTEVLSNPDDVWSSRVSKNPLHPLIGKIVLIKEDSKTGKVRIEIELPSKITAESIERLKQSDEIEVRLRFGD
jgi:molybdate transport system regulatory protein